MDPTITSPWERGDLRYRTVTRDARVTAKHGYVPTLSLLGTGDDDGTSNDLISQPTPGGRLFIESISEVDPGSLVEGVDPDRTEDPNQLLQNTRFEATIRGWSHRVHQHRVTTLLNLQNEPLGRRIRENQDLILLPASW